MTRLTRYRQQQSGHIDIDIVCYFEIIFPITMLKNIYTPHSIKLNSKQKRRLSLSHDIFI